MQQHFFTRAAAVLAAGAMLVLAACSDQGTSTSPLLADRPSMVNVGDVVGPDPTNEVLTVCKVWVNVPDADIDVTVSGSTNDDGTYTVPSSAGPTSCRAVAIQGGGDEKTITVTEADPGMGFTTTWSVVNTLGATSNGSGLSASATIGGAGPKGATITFTNTFTPPPPPTGTQGCTPGYWKQEHHFDSWVGYSPTDKFDTVFGVTAFGPNFTLLDALKQGGGGIKALGRHAVAGLLSATAGFYPMTEAEVIAAVQAALAAGGDIEGTKNTFEHNNELGCPLN
ncbi:MAG TPA: hypothetical protein VF178_15920 [Gemmatimonadaceae bacterium]